MRHTYVHVPFCARRCSYCDFSITVSRTTPDARFLKAIETELALRVAQGAWDNDAAETIYFGGGTPSRLSGDALADLVGLLTNAHHSPLTTHHSLARASHLAPAVPEITLEANPEDVTPEKTAAWKKAGVNRISLGAQSFDPGVLQWMHRTHDVAAIPRAVAMLRDAGIENYSLDLIFGLPDDFPRAFERDLDAVIGLSPRHLSVYGLTVEARTPLARWISRGETPQPEEERYVRDFLLADRRLAEAGFEHYEVSNYARAGGYSRHNSAYWQDRRYVGLGPAAHSYDGVERRWNIPAWVAYERALSREEDPTAERETLTPGQRLIERLYLRLRTRTGIPRSEVSAGHLAGVAEWQRQGWVENDPGTLRLTPDGWLRLDEIVTVLTT